MRQAVEKGIGHKPGYYACDYPKDVGQGEEEPAPHLGENAEADEEDDERIGEQRHERL
jgi:hypothetical protein